MVFDSYANIDRAVHPAPSRMLGVKLERGYKIKIPMAVLCLAGHAGDVGGAARAPPRPEKPHDHLLMRQDSVTGSRRRDPP